MAVSMTAAEGYGKSQSALSEGSADCENHADATSADVDDRMDVAEASDDSSAEPVDFARLRGIGEQEISSDSENDLEALAVSDLPSQVVKLQRIDNVALEHKLTSISLFNEATSSKSGKLGFRESLSSTITLDGPLSPELANDDIKREERFAELATCAVHSGLSRLRQMQIKFRRPSDYFAEMAKSDAHMTKVKARMLHEKEKIETAQKNRNMRDIKKNRKKVRQTQLEQEQGKRQRANQEISTVERLRKNRLREKSAKGIPAGMEDDDDEFPVDLLDIEEIHAADVPVAQRRGGSRDNSGRRNVLGREGSSIHERQKVSKASHAYRDNSQNSRATNRGKTNQMAPGRSTRRQKPGSGISKLKNIRSTKLGSKKRPGKSRRQNQKH